MREQEKRGSEWWRGTERACVIAHEELGVYLTI